MTNKKDKKKITEFTRITGCNESVARKLLGNHHMRLEKAINAYFLSREPSEAVLKRNSNLAKIFDQYSSKDDPGFMIDESLQEFFTIIGVDPDGLSAFIVFWLVDAKNMAEIERREFISGFTNEGVDTLSGIQSRVEGRLNLILENDEEHRIFYKWLFQYLKEDPKNRTIQSGLGVALWGIVFNNEHFPLLQLYSSYIRSNTEFISRDLWDQSYEFLKDIDATFETYDSDGAWPCIIDEFVVSLRRKE